MNTFDDEVEYNLDASSFQKPLIQLAEVLAQKVKREAPKLLSAPPYVAVDLHVLMRQAILLCIITELQAYFRFDDDGARINERVGAMWNVLMPVFEVKELYEERYKQLMNDRHMTV